MQNKYPNNLTVEEYNELHVKSAIANDLIERNFTHVEGDSIYTKLLISEKLPRTNTGRIASGFLKRYQHAEKGGYWISGLDPQNNWQPMEWGRFKPTKARVDEKGKLVKYESPPQTPNRVTYFDVSDRKP